MTRNIERYATAAASGAESLDVVLGKVGRRDDGAFEELYRRTAAKLFGICLRISSTRQEAEDALQDTYLTIWRRADSFDEARGSAIAWLAVLTRHAAIDRARRRPSDDAPAAMIADAPDPAPLAWEVIGEEQDARRLRDCLLTIDADDAHMIRTAFLDGQSYAQLAAAAQLPLGTVKSRIRRAFLKLRACLR